MRRGDGIWFNVGGNGDRGLVLEVRNNVLRHLMYGEGRPRQCARILWQDGTSNTCRPEVHRWGDGSYSKYKGRPTIHDWYPVVHLRVEYPYRGDV